MDWGEGGEGGEGVGAPPSSVEFKMDSARMMSDGLAFGDALRMESIDSKWDVMADSGVMSLHGSAIVGVWFPSSSMVDGMMRAKMVGRSFGFRAMLYVRTASRLKSKMQFVHDFTADM